MITVAPWPDDEDEGPRLHDDDFEIHDPALRRHPTKLPKEKRRGRKRKVGRREMSLPMDEQEDRPEASL